MLFNLNKILLNRVCLHSTSVVKKMKLVFDPRLKGMKVLDKELFDMQLNVPAIKIKKMDYLKVRRILKHFSFDSVVSCKRFTNLPSTDSLCESHKYILLDPDTFSIESLDETVRSDLFSVLSTDVTKVDMHNVVESFPIDLHYDDFKFDDVLKAIIPDELLNENVNVKGYSIIGHVAHFNLRDKVLEYKELIGI